MTDSKITITWTASPGEVSGYRVSVAQVGADGLIGQQTVLPVMHNTYAEVTPLEPGTLYRFFIFALMSGEESEPLVGEYATSKYLQNSGRLNRLIACHLCKKKKKKILVFLTPSKNKCEVWWWSHWLWPLSFFVYFHCHIMRMACAFHTFVVFTFTCKSCIFVNSYCNRKDSSVLILNIISIHVC